MYGSFVKDTSPYKTMEYDDSVFSSIVVKNRSPSKPTEYDGSVNRNVTKVVNCKIKTFVPCVSERVKTGNSLKSELFDTLKMILTLLKL